MAYEAWYGPFGAFAFDPTSAYSDGVLKRAFRGNQIYLDDAPSSPYEAVRHLELESLSGVHEFDLAINSYIARGDFAEGIVDAFEDETGVDTITSTNEVYNVADFYEPDTGLDMTLVSADNVVNWMPFSAAIVISIEEVDTPILNTDIKAWVSADGGSNYTQITLSKAFDVTLTKFILIGTVTIGTRGSTMKWKVSTHNTIDVKIHSVALIWR